MSCSLVALLASLLQLEFAQILLDLTLDALQRVVDRLHVAVQVAPHLLVRLAFEIAEQDLRLEVTEVLLNTLLDVLRSFLIDEQRFWIRHLRTCHHIEQRPLAIFIIDRLIERDVLVEWDVFLPRCGLDRGDDLSRDAQFREAAKRR